MTGNGSGSAPFRAIGVGIARAGAGALPPIVCVAGGTYAENITLRNGVLVYGGYVQMGATWPRTGATTTVNPTMDRGAYLDRSVTAPTILDGFVLNAANTANNAAVTVEGSTGAVVSGNTINGNAGQNSVGVSRVRDAAGRAANPCSAREQLCPRRGQPHLRLVLRHGSGHGRGELRGARVSGHGRERARPALERHLRRGARDGLHLARARAQQRRAPIPPVGR
jgi:hypothetical protein